MSSNTDFNGPKQRKKPLAKEPLPREKLPQELQHLVDDEESLLDQLYDGTYVRSLMSALPFTIADI